jgi:hypothetical protein
MINFLKPNKFFAVLSLLIALSFTLATATVSSADSLREEMGDFQHFMREHPRIASDLQRDPSLANNRRYLNDHDNLRDFLHNHPQVRRELSVNPGRAMAGSYGWNSGRYGDYQRYGDYRRYDERPWYWPFGSRR